MPLTGSAATPTRAAIKPLHPHISLYQPYRVDLKADTPKG